VTDRKLNAGCGTDIRKGWVNLDHRDLPGVDVVHDLESHPLPFEDGEFAEILCRDVLEHLEYMPLMGEIHRILAPGGVLRVRVPHHSSVNNYADPTHRHFFSIRTFDFFVEGSPLRKDYLFDYAFSEVRSRKLTFEKGILLYNHVVQPLINLSPRLIRLYESTWISRAFPAENVVLGLVK